MDSKKRNAETEIFSQLAEDALSLLRINLVLVGLYFSGFGLFYQSLGSSYVRSILNASYTQLSFQALFASMVASVLLYRKGRRIAFEKETYETAWFKEELHSINLVTASAMASVGSVVLLVLGIIQAFSGVAPPVTFPIVGIAFFIVVWILVPWAILTVTDLISDKSDSFGRIREILL